MSEKCAVILAGGKGTRLRPYTIAIPKPLVPVGDLPILEIIIKQLKKNDFNRIILTVNHQADIIKAYFQDGKKWGLNIEYSLETSPLGTMGPLKLIADLPDNFLVMNGDILTDLNYAEFFDRHVKQSRLYSICSFRRNHKVDYGVLHVDKSSFLSGFEEKPQLAYTVSMGIYAASKKILQFIPENEFYGFDSLMHQLISGNKKVFVDQFDGYWLDIGRPEDYTKAIEDYENGKGCFAE